MPPKPPGVAALASKFGGAPPCTACGKSCYLNEQVKHNEKVFHEACFCCKVCSMRIVSIGQATEYQGQIYHKTCLPKVRLPPPPSPRNLEDAPPRSPQHGPAHDSPSKLAGPPSRPPPTPPTLDTRRDPTPVVRVDGPRTPVAARTVDFGRPNEDPKVKEMQAKLAELEILVEKERTRSRALETSLAQKSADSASAGDSEHARKDATLAALRAENAELRRSLEDALGQTKTAQLVTESVRAELAGQKSAVMRLELEVAGLHKETDTLKKGLKEKSLELEAKTLEAEHRTESMGALSSELQVRTAALEKLTAENHVLQEDLKLFEAEIVTLTEQNHALQQQQQQQQPTPAQPTHQPPEPDKHRVEEARAKAPISEADFKLLRELVEGHTFTWYRVDPEHPDSQPTKETVLVFYEPRGVPEGHKGWICWNVSGVRQVDPELRIAVNPYTQLAAKNARNVFRASRALPQRCFSVLGADEDNVLDLEADSETRAARWLEGLAFLLKCSKAELEAALGADDECDGETLEQKQRIEELQKLEMDLKHEVEQLKVRKQALLEAEPIDDTDTY